MDYVYIQIAAYFSVAVIAFIIVARKAGFIKFTWNRTFSLMILKNSFPFAVLGMLMSFYGRIDGSMLERMIHDKGAQAGIYAQAFRFLDATNMIAVLAAGLLLPMFSRMLKTGEAVESMVKTAYTLLFALAIVVACGCIFYSHNMMSMLYKNDVAETSIIFPILMCCFMGSATQYVFGTLLTANGSLKYLNIIAGCGVVTNITLNLILIPRYQAVGAAIAGLTTQLLVPGIQVFVVRKMFGFKIFPKMMLTLLLFAIGMVAFAYGSTRLPFNWLMSFAIMLGAGGLWALITGVVNVKSILKMAKVG